MASSGNFTTSIYSVGSSYPNALYFEWWTNSTSTANNTTTIGFNLKTSGGNSSSWARIYNTTLTVDGQVYTCGTINGYGAGATTLISGTKTISHNSDGTRSFTASASAGIYANTTNVSGSGTWSLDTIARWASISGSSGARTDEDDFTFTFSNPAGLSVSFKLELPDLGYDPLVSRTGVTTATSGTYTMTLTDEERAILRSAMASVKSTTLRYTVYSTISSSTSYSYLDSTISISGGEPDFDDFTYKDTSTIAQTLVGDDQQLLQNVSTLYVDIPPATANKGATIAGYQVSISGASEYFTASGGRTLSDISQVQSGTQTLAVRAIDSRGNYTEKTKDITVIPYSAPSIALTAARENNWEEETTLTTTVSISPVNNGTEATNDVTVMWYRTRQSGASEWGEVITRDDYTYDPETGKVTVPNRVISLDNNYGWEIEHGVADRIQALQTGIVEEGE